MSWLLDTCMVAELVKPKPSTRVIAWIESCEEHSLFLSVITLGALEKGVAKFRWYDLRHTWASSLTQNRVPPNLIQEMGAWQSAAMVRRYAHLAPEQFGQHAKVVDKLLNGAFMSQASQQPKDEGAASY